MTMRESKNLKQESENVKMAKDILRGQASKPREMLKLAKRLKEENAFGYARKILARARKVNTEEPGLRLELAQQHALCTYKDPDLPTDARLENALKILEEVEDLNTTKNQETLGIAGAIYKRLWEVDSQRPHLERSLSYYLRGYKEGAASDYGYTGINAAFVLDLLADQESAEAKEAATSSKIANSRGEEAKQIRENLVSMLPKLMENQKWLEKAWWFLVTIAEAHFGLGHYQEALPWLKKAAALSEVPDWERESTTRQLATIARLQEGRSISTTEPKTSEVWQVLREFLGNNVAAVSTAFVGKVGLALSGGGFRASLFHIGVLAKLAELDMLRHVEVLSCVSGGSIIGAHYYLEVRKLFKDKTDAEIRRQDYIDIVQRIERDFLAGVQRNIRTRVAAGLLTNLKMIFSPLYSRTQRVGELYEKEIFSKVNDDEGYRSRWLNELFVKPKGEPEAFKPKYHNWKRQAKVPILILNATTLNTGHNWQFTASWMGEPPAGIDTEIDSNYRLRRMYYDEAPDRHQKVRLGHAVAASSCVPGLFEPLTLASLYPGITVRLVDGGVHDNQGITGLLEQNCTVLLVSDASGQMESQDHPKSGLLGVPLRSNNILMARVREAQYHELKAHRRSSLLRGLMFVHLKKDLDVDPVDWIGCKDPQEASDEARPAEHRGMLTSYGIQKYVQKLLAAIRTDLDSFSDAEAYALMTSGYRMTEYEFKNCITGFEKPKEEPQAERPLWHFLAIENLMKPAEGSEAAQRNLMRLLEVASNNAFKIWRLSRLLQIISAILGIAALLGLGWASLTWRSIPLLTVGMIVPTIVLGVISLIIGKTIVRIMRFRKTLTQIGIGLGMSLVGWLVARAHLYLFDRWYLHRGRIDRLIKSRGN